MNSNLRPYPEYKDSGIEWLGQVPAHWHIERGKNLYQKMARPVEESAEVVTCFRDGTVTLRRNRRTEGFTNSLKEIGYQGIQRGDLVIHAMDAFAGAIGVSDSDGKCTPVYAVCAAKTDLDNRYFAYLMREMARSEWILALARGIRERSTDFRFDAFGAQHLPMPSKAEQTAIATYLDDADRKIRRFIRNRRRLIEVLNEQKHAIISRAVTRGLDPNVRLKPSGVEWLGDIPEHWEVVLNQRIFKETIRPFAGGDEPPLSLSQRDGLVLTDNLKERSLKTATYDNWKIVFPNDLVLNRFKAHLGVFFASSLSGMVSFHYGVYAPRRKLNTKYYEHIYHTTPYRTIYAGRSNGMTVGLQNLSNQNFYAVRSPVPPLEEQNQIVSAIENAAAEVDQAIEVCRQEIALIREYRTCLIADVVTGKVDVREVAEQLVAAGVGPNDESDAEEEDVAEDAADTEADRHDPEEEDDGD